MDDVQSVDIKPEIPPLPYTIDDSREMDELGIAMDRALPSFDDSSKTNDISSEALESVNIVGKDTQVLIEMLTNLDHLGIDATNEIHLPKIVVVGDQSAGKSSLIEAISEIRVPRSSGTCTRCPLQISLVCDPKRTEWFCKVKLQRLYDYDQAGCNPDSPFFPWQERAHPLTIAFNEVGSKDDLEETLVRAQAAILNPGIDPSHFLTLPLHTVSDPTRLEVKFSPNIICLDICASNIPNLAFYDLPGIINQTEDADEIHLVSLVENLAEKYVRDEDALVLLACSLEGDVANSSAARLVRKFRAVNRCVGVLTKPDRFPKGDDVNMIAQMLQGKKYQLGHGYFVTKQPGQAEMVSISHADARIQERDFFARESPWNDELFNFCQDRFGTGCLQSSLSQKLAAMIVGRFSSIRDSVRQKKADLESKLLHMPKPPMREESHTRVNMLLLEFSKRMELHTKGEDPDFSRFLYDFKYTIVTRLKHDFLALKPVMVFDSRPRRFPIAESRQSPTKPGARSPRGIDSSSSGGQASPKKRKIDSTTSSPGDFLSEPEPSENAFKCTAEDIQKALSQYSVDSGISSEDNPRALDKLRLRSLAYLHIPAADFIKNTVKLLETVTKRSQGDVMKEWRTTLLYKEVEGIVKRLIDDLIERQISLIEREVKLETMKPITCDEKALERLEEAELEGMEQSRHRNRVIDHFFSEWGAEKFASATQREWEIKFRDGKVRSELGPDPLRHEIRVMAKVRAYFCLATNRLVDFMVRHMQLEMFEAFRSHEFYDRLMVVTKPSIGEDVPARCATLLADDAEREKRRRILQHQKDAMDEAWKYLQVVDEKFR